MYKVIKNINKICIEIKCTYIIYKKNIIKEYNIVYSCFILFCKKIKWQRNQKHKHKTIIFISYAFFQKHVIYDIL